MKLMEVQQVIKPALRRTVGGAQPKPRESILGRAWAATAEYLDHTFGWHRLPKYLGLAVLLGLRTTLRKENLYDTSHLPTHDAPEAPPAGHNAMHRSADGSWNDRKSAAMGMANTRFGRNIPLESVHMDPDQLMSPNPRQISRELLTREQLVPATTVNALVASWLQFMVFDWFDHGEGTEADQWEVELLPEDPWPEPSLRIRRFIPDGTRPDPGANPPTFLNTETHWWDASQIYGSNSEEQHFYRTGSSGKLYLDDDGLPVPPQDPEKDPTRKPGFWLGQLMMQTLFRREHNAICDRLRAEYPTWSDEEYFQRARLINAALIAKIHTVEWTPAVISHPTTATALRLNWWGLAGERIHRIFGRISSSEVISGIPGSPTDHDNVPFSITEEFGAVYRMHPLIPDDYRFRSNDDDSLLGERTMRDIAGPDGSFQTAREMSMANAFYTFGTMHPGLVTLHNFPKFLQTFERPDGALMDLAATDILREREQGIPRYNEFRRLLHMKPFRTFEEMAENPDDVPTLRRLYEDDIEKVDLMVGMFAEKRPAGFAFSDTAFRVFILMASRRLNSDRFFTTDYRQEVYSKAGMDWIADNTFATVLTRHYPELSDALGGLKNAFLPWRSAATEP